MTTLDDIRACLEGAVPAVIATCDADGVPNLSYVSQLHYVDARHVALTFQFFNKTHRNIAANPQATVNVIDPDTAAQYRLALLYRHTETDGALYASLKAKLAGIASHTGMTDVFRLKGADIYRVLDIECVSPGDPARRAPRPLLYPALRAMAQTINHSGDLPGLIDVFMDNLRQTLGISHAMLLWRNETGSALYTVASVGYPQSGVGAEIPLGCGIAGVCAQERVPIRIAFGASEYCYNQAIREHALQAGMDDQFESAIPLAGLAQPSSQLAVPLLCGEKLLGVLYVESEHARRFAYDDEDVLVCAVTLFANRYEMLQRAQADVLPDAGGLPTQSATDSHAPAHSAVPVAVRYYPYNHSVFINQDYLIKGVAGAIFWRLLQLHQHEQRDEFTNRELRLDASLGLPEISENLEARLVLLQKRLAERTDFISIEKTGRGRFRLRLQRPVRLGMEQSS